MKSLVNSLNKILLISLAAIGLGYHLNTHAAGVDQKAIRSAYAYNFIKFIEWPEFKFETPGSPINFCVVGEENSAITFAKLNGKKAKGRPLKVVNINTEKSFNTCHLLFINPSEKWRLQKLLDNCKDRFIVSISEMKEFNLNGGVIELTWDSKKLRFTINTQAAEDAGLMISSRLLKLSILYSKKQ